MSLADWCAQMEAELPALPAELRRELAGARAFQLRLAERIAAASEVLSKVAERKRGAEGAVPRPLFEAAVRVLASSSLLMVCTDQVRLVAAEADWNDEPIHNIAVRLIRRAAERGVTGEESRG